MSEKNVENNGQLEVRKMPNQLIIFGPPGTGKSYQIHGQNGDNYDSKSYAKILNITSSDQIVHSVFHPEYTYGDFMGRLLPISTLGDNKVKYVYRPGHFLIALSEAYKRLSDKENGNVILVIDELNRGNAAAIFGSVFNLLDRAEDGWSSYPVTLSDMEYESLLQRLIPNALEFNIALSQVNVTADGWKNISEVLPQFKDKMMEKKLVEVGKSTRYNLTFKIRLPPNFYIFATINTSDESIYYMDSAFKRRWDWEYIDENGVPKNIAIGGKLPELDWEIFRKKLNVFLKNKNSVIHRLEDKLFGPYFISCTGELNKRKMNGRDISKVMFHLWDSVFTRDKKPLRSLLGDEKMVLATFGDFIEKAGTFVSEIDKQSIA